MMKHINVYELEILCLKLYLQSIKNVFLPDKRKHNILWMGCDDATFTFGKYYLGLNKTIKSKGSYWYSYERVPEHNETNTITFRTSCLTWIRMEWQPQLSQKGAILCTSLHRNPFTYSSFPATETSKFSTKKMWKRFQSIKSVVDMHPNAETSWILEQFPVEKGDTLLHLHHASASSLSSHFIGFRQHSIKPNT